MSSGLGDMLLYGADADPEHVGNLVVLEPLKATQEEYGASTFTEFAECARDLRQTLTGDNNPFAVGLSVPVRFSRREFGYARTLCLATPCAVAEEIGGDLKHISVRASQLGPGPVVCCHSSEHFLHKVLCFRLVADPTDEECQQRLSKAPVQGLKGIIRLRVRRHGYGPGEDILAHKTDERRKRTLSRRIGKGALFPVVHGMIR